MNARTPGPRRPDHVHHRTIPVVPPRVQYHGPASVSPPGMHRKSGSRGGRLIEVGATRPRRWGWAERDGQALGRSTNRLLACEGEADWREAPRQKAGCRSDRRIAGQDPDRAGWCRRERHRFFLQGEAPVERHHEILALSNPIFCAQRPRSRKVDTGTGPRRGAGRRLTFDGSSRTAAGKTDIPLRDVACRQVPGEWQERVGRLPGVAESAAGRQPAGATLATGTTGPPRRCRSRRPGRRSVLAG